MITMFKDGKEMTDSQMSIWLGKATSTFFITKLYKKGFSVEQIAEYGDMPVSIVRKQIAKIEQAQEKWDSMQ